MAAANCRLSQRRHAAQSRPRGLMAPAWLRCCQRAAAAGADCGCTARDGPDAAGQARQRPHAAVAPVSQRHLDPPAAANSSSAAAGHEEPDAPAERGVVQGGRDLWWKVRQPGPADACDSGRCSNHSLRAAPDCSACALLPQMDYPNHYLTHPAPWDAPEAVVAIVYFDGVERCGGATRIVPRAGADDPAYAWPYTRMPGVGGTEWLNDRSAAEAHYALAQPETAAFRAALCARRPVSAPDGRSAQIAIGHDALCCTPGPGTRARRRWATGRARCSCIGTTCGTAARRSRRARRRAACSTSRSRAPT